MEANEANEEYDFGELCAEILENWNSPIYTDLRHNFVHQNPFSLHQFNVSSHTQRDICQLSLPPPLQAFNSIPNNEGTTEDIELQHNQDKTVNVALITTNNEKEEAEKFNDGVGTDATIPHLVADTFYEMLLGHGLDGIDVAISNTAEESNTSDESEDDFRIILNQNDYVSTKNGIEMEKLHSGHEISSGLKCDFLIHKEYPNAGENKCMPVTSNPAPTKLRSCSARGLDSKLKFKLPSNK